jgi:formylglycine-generating enzyme required for sulfatase activity
MSGNVWQWVQDLHHASYEGAPSDGSAWQDEGVNRVYRGGSWRDFGRDLRSADRDNTAPKRRYDDLGFRPARSLPNDIEAEKKDWQKLKILLSLDVVADNHKRRWAEAFLAAYGKAAPDNPYSEELVNHVSSKTAAAWSIRPEQAKIRWIRIPGGSFMMGAVYLGSNAQPHHVTVPPFEIAKTEVTRAQYKDCVKQGACSAPGCGWPVQKGEENLPVVCVDWHQAKAFSEWAGGRLPTEAEWEYAARSAGKNWRYPWGDEDATCERAVIAGCRNASAPVCLKPAGNTEQGLCDMSGNVWEWVQDWYHDSYEGAPSDGRAWESPPGVYRVFRGGSWSVVGTFARPAGRSSFDPNSQDDYLGFRPVRETYGRR